MRYELLLQPKEPTTPFDEERVRALLAARKVRELPDGTRVWTLAAGEIELRPLREAGKVIGAELDIPLKDDDALIREVVHEAAELAREGELRLMDPQLLRDVHAGEEGAVAEQFLRTARYAAEYAGLPDVVTTLPPERSGFPAGLRVIIGIGAFFLVIYLLMQHLF